MEGAVIKELAERLQGPKELENSPLVAVPSGWKIEDPRGVFAAGPLATAFTVSSLTAIADYLRTNRDKLDLNRVFVHVASPTEVRVFGDLDEDTRKREGFLTATTDDMAKGFIGNFMDSEDFVLGLQTRFTDAGQRAAVMSIFGSVTSEVVASASDDGVTQVVQTKAGVILKGQSTVPNPVTLTPYRTFREVEQPESKFVLRVRRGREEVGAPTVGLFEGDGGAWRLDAIARVAAWLRSNLPEGVTVLG